MIKSLREQFNNNFTEASYQQLINNIKNAHPGALDFRIAETPVFIPTDIKNKMLATCEAVIDFILRPDFKELTERSIPQNYRVQGEEGIPEFIVFDFGICKNENGTIDPQLIEMQGFPSLFAYQSMLSELMTRYTKLPDNFSSYLNGFDKDKHLDLLKEIIIGNHTPSEVILMDIYPEKQKTRIDFYCTEKDLGIPIICFEQIIAQGEKLYYKKDGSLKRIKRIFNRMIFDDLFSQEAEINSIDLFKAYDVEWVPHPNWFYRISKFTLPFIDDPNIPETYFLNEIKMPLALDKYVLKPLFSFAGTGVQLHVTQDQLDAINDPENWILQEKTNYASVVDTPDDSAKVEVRLFYYWKKDWDRPRAVHNLARLSKGEMIGTRYNADRSWVGGSIAFFEKD